jgi:DNA-binding transcriptional MerR regulator
LAKLLTGLTAAAHLVCAVVVVGTGQPTRGHDHKCTTAKKCEGKNKGRAASLEGVHRHHEGTRADAKDGEHTPRDHILLMLTKVLDLRADSKPYPQGVNGYRISEVADRTGIPATTLRYYEDIGVMPSPQRTTSGYRVYDDRTISRLDFISGAKQLGLSLEELRTLVGLWDGDECGPVHQEMARLVDAKISEVASRAAELEAFAVELGAIAVRLRREPHRGPCDDTCACATIGSSAAAAQPVALVAKSSSTTVAEPAIACTLSGADDVTARLAEWQHLLAQVVAKEAIDGGLRLTFPNGTSLAGEIARLASGEVACCAWLAFTVRPTIDSTILEVRAPAGGQQALTVLFRGVS